MKKIGFALVSSLILLSSCNTTQPPSGGKGSAVLSLADASCTEAWLKLRTSSVSLPANVELYKNNSLNQTINLTAADTIGFGLGLYLKKIKFFSEADYQYFNNYMSNGLWHFGIGLRIYTN